MKWFRSADRRSPVVMGDSGNANFDRDAPMTKYQGEDNRDGEPDRREKSGIKFDSTINLGHVLTFIGFLLSGFLAWSTLDKRVVVLEEGRKLQIQIDASQDLRTTDTIRQMKDLLVRLERQVERLNDRLDKTPSK